MLFMHNKRYLLLTGLLTYFVLPKNREFFKLFQKHFRKYFVKYFTPKNFMKFHITTQNLSREIKNVI